MLLETMYRFKHRTDLGEIRDISESDWQEARRQFSRALAEENSPQKLEEAVLDKASWDLPVDCKLALLKKAKAIGCGSFKFWQDYYKYLAAYLEPDDPEHSIALEMANGRYL